MAVESLQQQSLDESVIERFKWFFSPFSQHKLGDIAAVYADTVVFRDPVHQLHGLDALHDSFYELSRNIDFCTFEYLDETVGDGFAFITWNMLFRHPYLAGGKQLNVRGITHAKFHERIYYHEDFYDMGAMLYDNVPVLGGMTRWLKRRLQGDMA